MATDRKKKKAKKGGFLKYLKMVLQGRTFSLDFFKAHWLIITVVVGLFCITISNRYICQNKMKTILRLQKELVDAKTNRVQAESEYKVLNVPSRIETLIQENHMDLRFSEKPPVKIFKQPL